MDLIVLDYLANSRTSFIHRLPALLKLIITCFLIATIIAAKSPVILFLILVFLYSLILSAKLPLKIILPIAIYPIIFALILALAYAAGGWSTIFAIILRVIDTATTMVILFATTPYPYIFDYLGKIMPGFLSALIFLTYRAVFILSAIFSEIKTGFYLRQGIQVRRPVRSLLNLSRAFGYLISRGLDMNEKFYEALSVRGFKGKLYHHPIMEKGET